MMRTSSFVFGRGAFVHGRPQKNSVFLTQAVEKSLRRVEKHVDSSTVRSTRSAVSLHVIASAIRLILSTGIGGSLLVFPTTWSMFVIWNVDSFISPLAIFILFKFHRDPFTHCLHEIRKFLARFCSGYVVFVSFPRDLFFWS